MSRQRISGRSVQKPRPPGSSEIVLRNGIIRHTSFTFEQLQAAGDFILSFAEMLTLAEVAQGATQTSSVSVRHDIDFDMRHALKLAQWEASRGIRSSYYVLFTAPYAQDLPELAVEIQKLGHEVGVHNDSMTVANGDRRKAIKVLAGWADLMRGWGIDVHGCADHGAGTRHPNIALWERFKPEDAGLEYEAYHLHESALYISDNHGRLRKPLKREPYLQTHMLIHPIHWSLDKYHI